MASTLPGSVTLPERGVVRVAGADALPFLDNLVTNDLVGLTVGEARFAALLTPQGKILFEFLVVGTADGMLLEVGGGKAAELVKRLGLYKLRAKVEISDLSTTHRVSVGGDALPAGALAFADPRHADLPRRSIVPAEGAAPADAATLDAWHARRVALGVSEGGADYPLGDTFAHEANLDRLHGVSFSKGCFVGQEVVARMQHKTIVRKRVARIACEHDGALQRGAEVKVGAATIGMVGTVAGLEALALVRLDRVAEALDKGQLLTVGGVPITVDAVAVGAWRQAAAARASGGASP